MPLDLYALADPLVETINPLTDAILRRFVGIEPQRDYSTQPRYQEQAVQIDVQPLASSDLQLTDNIQQQSDTRIVYLRGIAGALNRPLQQGGDVLIFDGSDWLITKILEEWGDTQWRKVVVTRQLSHALHSN